MRVGLGLGISLHRPFVGGSPTPTPTPAPAFTTQPSISDDGTPTVGETLTGNDGTITNGTVSARQWLLNGSAISGATGGSYVPTEAGDHAYRVTATGAGGSTAATSAVRTVAAAPAPTPTPTAQRFGALTQAGYGGVPVTGTSITSGDPSGHWQISGGFLSPSTAGRNANFSGAPYNLTLNDGTQHAISIDANAYDVATKAEWDVTAMIAAATLAGKTIYLRPGLSFDPNITGMSSTPLRRGDFRAGGGLVVQSRSAINRASFTTPINVTFRGFTLRNVTFVPSSACKVQLNGLATFPVSNIWIDGCEMDGLPVDTSSAADYTNGFNPTPGAGRWSNDRAVRVTGTAGYSSAITLTNNTARYVARFCTITAQGNAVVTGNLIGPYYDAAIQIAPADAGFETANDTITVTDNVIWGPCAKATDAGAPHNDAFILSGRTNCTQDVGGKIERNISFHGGTRGQNPGIYVRDFAKSGADSLRYYTGTVIGNLVADCEIEGIAIQNAKNVVCRNNTVLSNGLTTGPTMTILIGGALGADYSSSGTHIVENNVAEGYAIGGTPTMSGNVTLANGINRPAAYADAFNGPTFEPTSRAEALAWLARKAGGSLASNVGAVGSGAVTWATTSPGSDGVTQI